MTAGSRPGAGCLGRDFFARPTLQVARDLVGRRLVRIRRGRRLAGRIVEVEAYIGAADTACHGSKGITTRNRVLFGPPGRAYVYFSYGLHHLLNCVTGEEGFPAAVLLRALEPEEGLKTMTHLRGGTPRGGGRPAERPPFWLAGGPARLCQALDINLRLNGVDLALHDGLWVEEGKPPVRRAIVATPRIGIDYADARDRLAPWRFVEKASPCLSRRP
jgi:DNA-3-methyladenine glycosylase